MTRSHLSVRIEVLADVATICVAMILAATLVKVYFLPSSYLSRNSQVISQPTPIAVGSNLAGRLPSVDMSKNDDTLLLAISTHCHFCTESAPFFRKLRDEVGTEVRIVAMLPEATADAQQYLQHQGIRVNQVSQIQLSSIGIRGTPTMLLVSKTGVVTNVWSGKLDSQEQEKVISTLRRNKSSLGKVSEIATDR